MKIRMVVLAVVLIAACRRRDATQPVVVAPTPTPGPAPAQCPADTVRTESGCVRGTPADTLVAYRGIPYAAPPIGDKRWRPPAPAPSWSSVREAIAFGKSCPQLETTGGKLDTAEDCLTLNVWAPRDPTATTKLPVMVWIHGGGLVQGGSALPFYDGARLAREGGVVVVTINYRLGALGFLAHPAFTAEDGKGNFGLLDQIAALRWVKTNIAAFGGDPNTVMIFGESAGAQSVCALMASPLATGLFTRAAMQSAPCVGYGQALRPLSESHGKLESRHAQGERIAKQLGCTGANAAACLRGKSADDVLRAAPAAVGFLSKGEKYGMTLDGHVLVEPPAALMATGKLAKVPLLVGTTADEGTLFTGKRRIGPLIYPAIVKRIFKDSAPRVLAEYSPSAFGGAQAAFEALVTDVVFTCPARRVARAMPGRTYRFLFSHVTAKNAAAGKGATHGSEIPFVFGTQSSPTAAERALATTMVGYWTRFAKTGDPNVAGAPAWPLHDDKDSYLELATTIRAATGLRSKRCDLLDTLAPDQLELED